MRKKKLEFLMRKKYRILNYNYSDRSIKLERKKKHGSYIFKESAPLTREEVEKILAGDYEFLLKSQYPLCREFYVECVSNMMRPRTIVDYDREPWIMDEGTVRVTFDRDVRAAIGSFDILIRLCRRFQCWNPVNLNYGSEIYRDASSDCQRYSAASCS